MTDSRAQYRARINRVVDYIEENLGREMDLDELSAVASFSKFHFHRVFAMMMGETLHAFIQRTRVEKAAVIIAGDPTRAVTDVAYDCGFSSPQAFAKQFRRRFGVSATEWRHKRRGSKRGQVDRNDGKTVRKPGNASSGIRPHIEYQQDYITWRYKMIDVERKVTVRTMDAATLAYIRHVGPYEGDGSLFERLWGKLMSWAGPRDLVKADTRYITVYHDSPDITDKDKLRISIGITVPKETPVDGEVSLMTLDSGKYAIAEFVLGEKEYGEAWSWVYGTWLPESGFVPDDRPAFEEYPIDGEAAGPDGSSDRAEGAAGDESAFAGKRRVNICIPVLPM